MLSVLCSARIGLRTIMLLLYIIDIYNSSDKLSYYLSADDINLLYADNNLIFRFHRIRTCLKFEAKEVVV